MPQINNGKSPPWVAGEIVTAAELNGMIDSATLAPSAVTDQTDFPTLTGNEYALIVDPVSGQLKKTQVKNIILTGEDVVTDNILGKSINGTLLIQPQGSTSQLNIYGGSVGGGSIGSINAYAKDINLTAVSSVDNTGAFNVVAGTDGMSFNSGNAVIEFSSRVELNTTGAIKLPVGTTALRPAIPVAGDARFNSTLAKFEIYDGANWSSNSIKVAVLTRRLTSYSNYSLTGYAWTDIPYNTINESESFVVNSSSFTGVLSSAGTGLITLPAGTYSIDAEASVKSGGGSAPITTRVYNNTSFSEINVGTTGSCGGFGTGTSIVYAVFSISTQSNISIQYYLHYPTSGITSAESGGTGSSPEVVFTAKITKLS